MKSHYGQVHEGSIAGVLVECAWCGKQIRRGRREVENLENSFCGENCFSQYNSKHRTGEDAPDAVPGTPGGESVLADADVGALVDTGRQTHTPALLAAEIVDCALDEERPDPPDPDPPDSEHPPEPPESVRAWWDQV